MATAKHRAIDHFRRNKRLERKHQEFGRELQTQQEMAVPDFDAALDDDIGDDLLRLVFISCHPVLSTEARVALTLRLLGGLTTEEIARAFLAPEPTIAQRIVRAKRTLAEERVPFEVPRGAELAARLSSVLEVIYLVFNEGYSATGGDDWMRPALCEDALRLGRILAELEIGRASCRESGDWSSDVCSSDLSASSGPSGPLPKSASPSRCRAGPNLLPVFRRCSRSSTSSSTRATRRLGVTTGCDPRSARMRSVSAVS